jgi:hypothetical protein
MKGEERAKIPASSVTLQIFALPLHQASSHFLGQRIILAGVLNVLCLSNGNVGVYKMVVVLNKMDPFAILWHSNRSGSKVFHGTISSVCFTLQNAGISIVGFLDFSNNYRLKFSSRCLKIEIGLLEFQHKSSHEPSKTDLMKIILLVDLLLDLTICSELEKIGVLLPRHLCWINIRLSQAFL